MSHFCQVRFAIGQDLEWDEPARQVRPTKPLKKLKLKKALPGGAAADDDDAEEEESSAANALSATAELAKESWEVTAWLASCQLPVVSCQLPSPYWNDGRLLEHD